MTITLYEISIAVFLKNLRTLHKILDKGSAHVGGKTEGLVKLRLIADMQPFSSQIQRASDTAKGVAVRVAKTENVVMEDNETTWSELHERIEKTIKFLEGVKPEDINDKEDAEVILKTSRYGELKYTAKSYIIDYAVPNFLFHVVTAYDLLRKEGVPVGKEDYLDRGHLKA